MKKLLALVVLASTMVATLATAAPADAAINCATPRILNQGYRAVARCLNQRADNQLSMIVGLQSRVHSLESSNTVAGLSARIDSLEARMKKYTIHIELPPPWDGSRITTQIEAATDRDAIEEATRLRVSLLNSTITIEHTDVILRKAELK